METAKELLETIKDFLEITLLAVAIAKKLTKKKKSKKSKKKK